MNALGMANLELRCVVVVPQISLQEIVNIDTG